MRRVIHFVVVTAFALEALVIGQGADVNKILADTRAALGGEKKMAALKSLTATGRTTQVNGDKSSTPTDVELAIELPDKYMKKDVLAVIMDTTITKTIGFNGDGLIDVVDNPPQMGRGMVVRQIGSNGFSFNRGAPPTPEEAEAARKASVLRNKQDATRLTLGMLAASLGAYPVEFGYEGQASASEGLADIITVKGEGEFAARLFVDSHTHMPLMLTWMGKEPLTLQSGGTRQLGGGSSMTVFGAGGAGASGSGQSAAPADRDQMIKDFDAKMKEAEANRKVVEYRMSYGDYKDVEGMKVPFRIQRSIDGKPTEELVFDKIRFNAKIDPKKFEVVK